MNIKVMRKIAGMFVISAITASSLMSQDRNAVIASFNEGAKLAKTDVPGAIKALENTITLADQVGESANDLKQKAAGALPGLDLKVASAAISE